MIMTQEKEKAPEQNSEAINNHMFIIPHPDNDPLDWKDESLIPHPDDDVETTIGKRLERLNRADNADALKEYMEVIKAESKKYDLLAEANDPGGVIGKKSTWFTTPVGLEEFESKYNDYDLLSDAESESHPFALLWKVVEPYTQAGRNSFLSVLLACCGMWLSGRTKFSDIIDPHIFAVLVGLTSQGAKGTATDLALEVMEDVLPGFDKQYVEGLVSTQEGLIRVLQPPYIPDPSLPELPESTEGITRKLIVLPEFSILSVVGKRQGNALNQSIRLAYDRSKQTVHIKKRKESLVLAKDGYVAGLLTNVTPTELRVMVNDTEARNGSANRFVYMWSERSKSLYEPKPWDKENDEKYQTAVKLLRDAMQCTARNHPVWLVEKENLDYFVHFSKEFEDLKDTFVDSLLQRKRTNFIKVSTILASTDYYASHEHQHCFDELAGDVVHDISHIPFEDLSDAAMWITQCDRTVRHVFDNQKLTDIAQRILYILSAHEDHQMEMSQLHKQLGNNLAVAVINDAINQLIKANLAGRHKMHNGKPGAPAILIRLIPEKGEKRRSGA